MARKVNRLSPFNVTSLALGLAFLYLPIIILVIYSFNESKLVTVWGGFSTKWYVSLFQNQGLMGQDRDDTFLGERVAPEAEVFLDWETSTVALADGERYRRQRDRAEAQRTVADPGRD